MELSSIRAVMFQSWKQKLYGMPKSYDQMNLTIHRGTNEIGGNCVEIATTTTRLLFDIGLPLDSVVKKPEDLKQYLPQIEGHIDAVFISHYHLDHHGLVSEIDPSIPVYVSAATAKMFGINTIFLSKPKVENLRIIDTKTPVIVGEIFVADVYVANVLYEIHELNAKIPSAASHPNIRVWYAKYQELKENENLAFRLKRFKIKSEEIAESPEKYVVIIRPYLLKYIQKINAAQANVVTSIWKDYEIRTENEAFFDWVDKKGYKRTQYHTSGHADQVGLKKIVAHISPKSIIPIHTANKVMYKELFNHVVVLDNGEIFEL
jgi:mRNA degradation ribonuclease J1/J2